MTFECGNLIKVPKGQQCVILMGKNGAATAHKPIKLEYEFATLSGPRRPAPAAITRKV